MALKIFSSNQTDYDSMHESPFLRENAEIDRSSFSWYLELSYLALEYLYVSIMETN